MSGAEALHMALPGVGTDVCVLCAMACVVWCVCGVWGVFSHTGSRGSRPCTHSWVTG